jgi:hypothetical protein
MNLKAYQHAVGSISAEFAETGLDINQLFMWSIHKMNSMYTLPINIEPSLDNLNESPLKRMRGFMKTLQKEMNEGLEIMALLTLRESGAYSADLDAEYEEHVYKMLMECGVEAARAEVITKELSSSILSQDENLTIAEAFDRFVLVAIADWLADMTVYNRSEALKFGIPLESVLACVMGSNFTKLGEDGLPVKDENGKVTKGPNFVPPEEAIYATMFEREELIAEAGALIDAAAQVESVALPILHDPMADILYSPEADELDWTEGENSNDLDSYIP